MRAQTCWRKAVCLQHLPPCQSKGPTSRQWGWPHVSGVPILWLMVLLQSCLMWKQSHGMMLLMTSWKTVWRLGHWTLLHDILVEIFIFIVMQTFLNARTFENKLVYLNFWRRVQLLRSPYVDLSKCLFFFKVCPVWSVHLEFQTSSLACHDAQLLFRNLAWTTLRRMWSRLQQSQ